MKLVTPLPPIIEEKCVNWRDVREQRTKPSLARVPEVSCRKAESKCVCVTACHLTVTFLTCHVPKWMKW